jgi:superfamily II DNA or RNA helicase
MEYFITNEKEKSLKKRLVELILNAKELKFLTAFFYFSALDELYHTLLSLDEQSKINQGFLKILVGLNIDKNIYGIYEYYKNKNNDQVLNINDIKEEFFKSMKLVFTSKDLDDPKIYEQFKFFYKLLKEGKLLIRKTKEPVHSKLYLFKFDNVITPALFITGSSNLTYAGLSGQYEFNVEIKDYGFDKAEEYFDKLWYSSVDISLNEIVNVIEKDTFFRKITPFEAYVYILKTYIDLNRADEVELDIESIMGAKGYRPYKFQLHAVSQAVSMINSHNGVILADVVGLGKTVIACLIGKYLRKRGLVLCPPHLIGDDNANYGWKKYLNEFELYSWQVKSIGKLEEALEFVRNNPNIDIIVVDEAHRFRNQDTKSYFLLSEICRGKKVILISATPFNNKPSDIFAMLKLFTIPKKSTIIYEQDLEFRFWSYQIEFQKLAYIKKNYNSGDNKKKERALKYYIEIFVNKEFNEKSESLRVNELKYEDIEKVDKRIKEIATEIRNILEPVVIRRNRLDLKYYGEDVDFPVVRDPIAEFFELNDEQLNFYDEILKIFLPFDEGGKFTGAIYFPSRYERNIDYNLINDELNNSLKMKNEDYFLVVYQKNLYDLIRRLLVRRFESSFKSFIDSIKRFKQVNLKILEFIKHTNKFILNKKLIEDVVELFDEDNHEEALKKLQEYEQQLLENSKTANSKFLKVYKIDDFSFKGDIFIEDIKKDIELFDFIINRANELNLVDNDPKFEQLVKTIDRYLSKNIKVVVFSEYIDTIKYLEDKLKSIDRFKDIVLAAYGDLSKSVVDAINQNFDAQYKNQKNNYHILLSTDKLSEGFNLNRAGVIINYDIPWNPVKVIQRVGRINRIGKKVYDEIYIVNFFPTEMGADILKSREIAGVKMFMIHNILGEDSKIFSPDEDPQPSNLYSKLTKLPDEEQDDSFLAKIYNEFNEISKNYPEVVNNIENMPNRVKVSKPYSNDEILVFIKRGNDLFVLYKDYSNKKVLSVPFESFAYERIRCDFYTPALELSKNFWGNYNHILSKNANLFRRSHKDYIQKAFNILSTLINKVSSKEFDMDSKLFNFVNNLRDDIVNYGTLSDYVLSEISNWKLNDVNKLLKDIEELANKIGYDFIDKVSKNVKTEKEEFVIVAIENVRDT